MFSKTVRKRLQEHNWVHIMKTDKNPSQVYRRFRDQAINAIHDLGLLASRLPDDRQYEIFNEETIRPLLKSILLFDKSEDKYKIRNPNLQLASLMVKEGIAYCLSEFRTQNKDTPESARPTIEQLERSILICNEISRQYQHNYIIRKALEMKGEFICIWEQIFASDKSKFLEYVYDQMNLGAPDLNIKEIESKKINEFHYVLWTSGDEPEGYYYLGEIKIVFSLDVNANEGKLLDDNPGSMIFKDEKGNEIKSKRVRIKKFGSEHVLFEIK